MWANAYLEQARSDWDTYKVITKNTCATCQELHYLQMTAEKLGKAVLLTVNSNSLDRVKKSHKTFTSFLRVAARNPRLRKEAQMNARQLQESIKEMLPVAYEIERLAPSLANDGPNAEYPWKNPTGQVIAPAACTFSVTKELRGVKGRKLLKLIAIILEGFESFF